ncbi:MAG: glycosyltransferase family 4 protein, partial [Bacteroidota bacterium]
MLLYVGRLVPFKGIGEVTEAFIRLAEKYEWSLQIVGAGEIAVPSHPRIQVQGFVQPEVLPSLAREAGAFVLASHVEPWGVALHEFAAAGLPLLASEAVGAADAFVRDGYNGFVHKAQDAASMIHMMEKLFQLDDATLKIWGDRSHQLAQQITPAVWAS